MSILTNVEAMVIYVKMSSLRDSLNLVVFHGLSPVSVMCSPLRGSFVIYVKMSSLRDSLNLVVYHQCL